MAFLLAGCDNDKEGGIDSSVLNNPSTLKDEKTEVPEIYFNKQEIDLGELIQGDIMEVSYQFENRGEAPLIISEVKGSCGCTVMKGYPKEPIAPGEGGTIQVQYNSTNKQGQQKAAITLATNARPATRVLYITANVLTPDEK